MTQLSLADAIAVLRSKKLVDLSQSVGPTTPVCAGFQPLQMTAVADPATGEAYTVEKHGFRSNFFALVGQCGTHIDPPAHFSTGITMDRIPLTEMLLPLVVFDVTEPAAADPGYKLSRADILAWEARHGRLPAGAFAALRTDLSKFWDSEPARLTARPFPCWSLEAIQFLIEARGVVAIGHESLDTDDTTDFAGETWLLRQGRWQIEAMANLDQVPPVGALLIATWPKIRNGLGFPARVFAILP